MWGFVHNDRKAGKGLDMLFERRINGVMRIEGVVLGLDFTA